MRNEPAIGIRAGRLKSYRASTLEVRLPFLRGTGAIAPVPDKPIAKGLPGPGLLSSVVVSKYADHLPLYRLEDVFARSGVELSRSTLCRRAMQAAAILEPIYQAMVERVRSSESIHTDDTPVPCSTPVCPKRERPGSGPTAATGAIHTQFTTTRRAAGAMARRIFWRTSLANSMPTPSPVTTASTPLAT
jgi:hypothetical protein